MLIMFPCHPPPPPSPTPPRHTLLPTKKKKQKKNAPPTPLPWTPYPYPRFPFPKAPPLNPRPPPPKKKKIGEKKKRVWDFLANQYKDKKKITRKGADDTCLLAISQVHVERILHQWTPIAWCEPQCNERRVCEDQTLCLLKGDMTANERWCFESRRQLSLAILWWLSRDFAHIMCFCIALSFSAYLIKIFWFAISWCNAHKERLRDIETDRQRDREREREREIERERDREVERERESHVSILPPFSGETLLKNLWFWLLTLIWG